MGSEFWLSETQWEAIGPLLPRNQLRAKEAVARADPGDGRANDSTAKAHRSVVGGKGGPTRRRWAVRAAGGPRRSMPSSMCADAPSPSK
jgi:hypothetical protein